MTNLRKHKQSETILFLIMLLATVLFSSCQEQIIYHSFRSIPTQGWIRKDTVCFDVAVTDSQTQVHLSLDLRNRNTYPFQNILICLSQENPEGQISISDTLSLSLADTQGMWTGQGWGGLYQSRFPLQHIQIQKAGDYHFKIHHLMPQDTLIGIQDVGILLEKAPATLIDGFCLHRCEEI